MSYKPEGYTSVSPYFVVESTDAVIAFLRDVFGAEELRRYAEPDGRVMHAEVRLDDSVIMMADASEEYPPRATDIHIYVPDVDETYRRALAFGASSIQAPVQRDDPDRRAGVKVVGSEVSWWFATTTEKQVAVTEPVRFAGAYSISGDIDALPVKDLGPAIAFYTRVLGFQAVPETRTPTRVRLRRDTAVIGLAVGGADPEQVSCYFSVVNVQALHHELTDAGVEPSELQNTTFNGQGRQIFFAKEPYGVCFCFGEPT